MLRYSSAINRAVEQINFKRSNVAMSDKQATKAKSQQLQRSREVDHFQKPLKLQACSGSGRLTPKDQSPFNKMQHERKR